MVPETLLDLNEMWERAKAFGKGTLSAQNVFMRTRAAAFMIDSESTSRTAACAALWQNSKARGWHSYGIPTWTSSQP